MARSPRRSSTRVTPARSIMNRKVIMAMSVTGTGTSTSVMPGCATTWTSCRRGRQIIKLGSFFPFDSGGKFKNERSNLDTSTSGSGVRLSVDTDDLLGSSSSSSSPSPSPSASPSVSSSSSSPSLSSVSSLSPSLG
ncbi:hypothetical protein BT96DRAFT_155527 [Gymnopus androsaceus JB14]|uniref:Uncharacterized protein n=1 Tax=Gymnopus androsaceus JB14 TaxID=1447944 RepID=A0A6A4HCD6_9AGAR|nr:hypothetical protein BT96DRAFT_155527 [Gymnopus androsaceus JB14]